MATYTSEWNPEAVIAAALDEVQRNAEIVGAFVESEARRRLDAIKQPGNKRAVAYRAFLSRYMLTNVVTRTAKEVVVRVGMKTRSQKGGDRLGFYIETGSRLAPAHPYLRPAVFDNAREIVKLLTGG